MTIAQRRDATDTQPDDSSAIQHADGVRVRFRQPVETTGYIDAAWWPRSRNLVEELPPLMELLWASARNVNRITYHLGTWDPAPRRMQIRGRTVRLGGFATSDPDTVRLSDPWGRERIDILVIAPETDPAFADRVFAIASETDNPLGAREILTRAGDPGSATGGRA